MLVGDLCLSVIPASPGDSGLFQREAYLSGAYPAWRLPLLLVTGLLGMALGFFAVRANYMQIKPQNCKTAAGSSYKRGYLSDLRGHGAFYDRQSGGLDQYPVPFAGPDGNCSGYSGLVYKGFSVFMDFIRRYDPVDPLQCLGGFCKENHSAAENVSVPYAGLADRAGRDPGCAADAGADISTWDFILSQGSGNAALLIWMAANAVWGQRRKKVLEVE